MYLNVVDVTEALKERFLFISNNTQRINISTVF